MGTYTISARASAWHIPGWLTQARTRLVRYWLYRRTLATLSALETAQLEDLGLSRSTLKRVARQAAYEAR